MINFDTFVGAFHPAHSHCEHDHDHSSTGHHESHKGLFYIIILMDIYLHLLITFSFLLFWFPLFSTSLISPFFHYFLSDVEAGHTGHGHDHGHDNSHAHDSGKGHSDCGSDHDHGHAHGHAHDKPTVTPTATAIPNESTSLVTGAHKGAGYSKVSDHDEEDGHSHGHGHSSGHDNDHHEEEGHHKAAAATTPSAAHQDFDANIQVHFASYNAI